jgi:hypothetical protein
MYNKIEAIILNEKFKGEHVLLPRIPIRGVFRLSSRQGIQIFALIQSRNVQVKFLVIFKSGESLIFVVFF